MSDQFGLNFAIKFFEEFRPSGVNGHEISRNFEAFLPNHGMFDKFRPQVVNMHEISRNVDEFRPSVVNIHEISRNFEDFRRNWSLSPLRW